MAGVDLARIFISHSSRDQQQAEQLKAWLASIGFERTFLDFDKHTGIAPGADWERTLYREMERAQAVILVLTRNWFDSKWCFAEFTQARALGKAIFAVVETPTGESAVVSSDIQHLDLTSHREEGLGRLQRELTKVALNAQGGFEWETGRPPYPGLLSFEAADAAIFFGRDDDIMRAIERVNARRVHGGAKLIAILGGSGSGKSSLLKAGVLPRLARDKANFLVAPPFRPGSDPLRGLLQSLQTLDPNLTRADLEAVASPADALGLIDRLRGAGHATLILALDQAEEAFTRLGKEAREKFFALLSTLLADDHPALGLLTLRADHLPDLQTAEGLTVAFEEFSLKPMPIERLGLVVEGPARIASLRVEEGLPIALMRDAKTQDALPLVAFVLRRLYDRYHRGGALGLAHYESLRDGELSPLEAAIRDAAKEAIEGARPSPETLAALREAFVPALVRVNDEGGFVRQSAPRDRLPAAAQALLTELAKARLLVVTTQDGVRFVEVAHEALFRVWPLLAGWLEEEREFLVGKSRIERAREDHARLSGTDRAKALLSGLLLERAKSWLIAHPARFSAEEAAFIRDSIAEAERLEQERAEERERLRQAELARAKAEAAHAEEAAEHAKAQTAAAKRLQRLALAAAVVFALLGAVAVKLWIDADAAKALAEKNYLIALDQAAGSVKLLVRSYDEGAISTKLMQQLMQQAEKTVNRLPGETDDVTAARIELLDAMSLAYLSLNSIATARDYAEREQSLADGLLAKNAGNRRWMQLWALARGRGADALYWQGDLEGAVRQARECEAMTLKLAQAQPEDEDAQWALVLAYQRSGDDLRAAGDFAGAGEAYRAWLDHAKRLREKQPGNVLWLRGLAFAYQRIGDNLLQEGKPAAALEQFRIYLSLIEEFRRVDPQNAMTLEGLAFSHERVGDALLAEDDAAGAVAEYRRFLDAATRLAGIDASNFRWREVLVITHQRLGDSLLREHDPASAAGEFAIYLSLSEELLAKDPSNTAPQYDVENAREKLGDAERERGDLAAALAHYKAGLDLATALSAKDPANATWQKSLAVAHQRLGMTLKLQGDAASARAEFQQCLESPVKVTAWTPRSTWPPDVHAYCRTELASLRGGAP